jgi:hypothetical protein
MQILQHIYYFSYVECYNVEIKPAIMHLQKVFKLSALTILQKKIKLLGICKRRVKFDNAGVVKSA